MVKKSGRPRRLVIPLIIASMILIGFLSGLFFYTPEIPFYIGEGWEALTQKSKRILRWEKGKIPTEEKRIREEVILKKMEEASDQHDWRLLAPEYPRPKKLGSLSEKERIQALNSSSEFKELERELKEYLKKKEDLFYPEPPMPSPKDSTDFTHMKDKAAEKVIENLLSIKEKTYQEKPLEENLLLGMKGPLAARKILERPNPPQIKLKMEAEIELTLYVLSDGMVDRVIPLVKGDAELDRIAIQYLKQWRFAPLSKDQPQLEQWGTIPIKFKLQ